MVSKKSCPLIVFSAAKGKVKSATNSPERNKGASMFFAYHCTRFYFRNFFCTFDKSKVNLLMLLETVLGTYFAWTILKEIPSLQVIFGGIIILLALFFSFYPVKKVKTL